VVRSYLEPTGVEVREVPFGSDGRTELAAVRTALDGAAGLIVGYPNFFGIVEPLKDLAALCRERGALLVSATAEPVAFGLLAAPGALGADIAVGEMQSFGNGLSFGGPGLGFFAAREAVLRQMPGRLCGATVDRQGRRGFVLTLSTREQHIKRERATSNICTNHGLNALAATIHLSLLGQKGLQDLARINWQRARYARAELEKAGLPPLFRGPTFNEFAVRADVTAARAKMAAAGIDGGLELQGDYPELEGGLLFCVTEVHSRAAIDGLAAALR
jgi:glycine dehydrogenase subunit 1